MSFLDGIDPTGAGRLRTWVEGLRNLTPGVAPSFEMMRMIHPGLRPAEGNGLVGAQPQSLLLVPGEDVSAVTLLRFITASADKHFDLHGRAALLGGLLTLVTDRRCQVVPEVFAKVEGQEYPFAIPVTSQIDSALSAPMPEWDDIDARFREVVARMTSMPDDEMAALSSAVHMHYCAALLMTRDLAAAYALVVGGIECLAQKFGNPPTEWQEWDQAASWEKFVTNHQLTEQQAEALRKKLMKDQHIKLAETFATYATNHLPADFWEQPVRSYTWGIDAGSTMPVVRSWSEPRPRGPEFVGDSSKVKAAFKTAYQLRSGFLHAGKREVTFVKDTFKIALAPHEQNDTGIRSDRPRLTTSQLRSALRCLILREMVKRGSADPKGLDEICFVTLDEPAGPVSQMGSGSQSGYPETLPKD